MSSKNNAFKNLMLSSAGLYVESFFAMLMSVIIARSLGPESYGNYALIVWIVAFGIRITNGGVTTATIKFVSECNVKYKQYIAPTVRYLRKIQILKLVFVLVIFSFFFLFLRERYINEISLLVCMSLLLVIVLRAFNVFYVSLSKGFENFKAVAATSIVSSPIHLLLVIAAALISNTLEGFIISYVLSSIVYLLVSRTIVLSWCKYDQSDSELPKEIKSRINKHVKIVMLNTLLLFLITNESELLFLKYFADGDDLGYFKVAHRLAIAIALLVPGIFEGILLPLMSRSIAESQEMAHLRFTQCIKYVMLMALPAAVFCVFYSSEIINILYGSEYDSAIQPFAILVATCCICSVSSVPTSYLLSVDRQSLILKVMLIGTVLKLGLDYYLIKSYGLYGASIAFSMSFSFMFLANLFLAMKHLKVAFPMLYFGKVILATMISAAFVLLIKIIFIQNEVASIIISAIIFSVVYINLSLLLRCWRADEIQFFREFISKKNNSVLKKLDGYLGWVEGKTK